MKLRKFGALTLALLALGIITSCNQGNNNDDPKDPVDNPAETTSMTYAEYVAAENDSEVTIEAYVQAKQAWWSNKATLYLQDDNGGYFVYELPCTEEQYNTDLAIGNKIQVTGIKGEWSGQVEILGSQSGAEATYKKLEGSKVYSAKEVTGLDNTKLLTYLNQKVKLTGLTVVSVELPESEGKDIYYNVTDGTNTLTFCVESYLTDASTDVYKTALTLKAGDVVTVEGFVYCYNTAQLHTTAMTITTSNSTGAMTYAEYVAAEDDSEVTIAAYVQAKQAWWNNKATVYLQDDNGGYFAYELPCTEEQYNTDLAIGNFIKITGIKGSWAGQVEILGSQSGAEAEYEVLYGTKVYNAKEVEGLDNSNLLTYLNQKVKLTGLTVVSVELPASEGKDIYYDVTDGTNILTFCVESYLTDASTDVYKTALTLKAGDVVTVEGYMYCYYTAQLHTTSMTITGNVLTKSDGTMTYAEYASAADGTEVTIEGFVQAKQAWWSNKATIYLQDENGGYFLYELSCTEEQYNTDLAIGKKVKVTGVKGSWAGMVEILGQSAGAEAEYEALEGVYLAPAKKVSLSDENLASYVCQKVSFEELTVVSVTLPESEGKDIYFDVTDGTTTYTFCVESYLTSSSTDVYQTVLALQAGDKISCEGYMYIYNNPQLHTTACTVIIE